MTAEEFDLGVRRKLRRAIIFLGIGIAGIIVSTIFLAGAFGISAIEDGDASNWITLLVEIGVAVIITVIVWVYTKFEQIQTNDVLSRINTMTQTLNEVVVKQEAFRKNRYDYAVNRMHSNLPMIKIMLTMPFR